MVTISLVKADVGGFPGHSGMHPALLEAAEKKLAAAKQIIIDFRVLHCGDDLELIMSHQRGVNDTAIHRLAWETFLSATEKAQELKLYGAGQDLLKDSFSGNVRGMGPGVAEMEFEERKSEPIIIFMADKTSPGAWNLPLYKMFADPFNTAGLIIDPSMHKGFIFEVMDVLENKVIQLQAPEELYDLLALIGNTSRYLVRRVFRKSDKEIAAVASVQRLNLIAGKYVGKDDPVLIVRAQSGFPALGEVVEPFALAYTVEGWMRGSHHGPLMPVGFSQANPTRFDGPPRVIAAGFQVANGKLIGPVDLFADVSFSLARQKANEVADYLRKHGPFQPHRLPESELEYTTLPQILEELKDRFEDA